MVLGRLDVLDEDELVGGLVRFGENGCNALSDICDVGGVEWSFAVIVDRGRAGLEIETQEARLQTPDPRKSVHVVF